jgi:MGT family glycosyltransferase
MSMSRHIAIFTLLNPGHLYPTLGLCSELTSRGYRVTYPTLDRFAEQIRQTGAEPVVIKIPELTNVEKILQYPAPQDPKFWHILTSIFWPSFLSSAARILAETETFYDENVPDLVLYDWFSFSGRILAKRLHCPAIQHWAHFAHRGFLIREDGVCTNPEPTLGFAHLLDSFMSAYGIEEKDNLWHTENLNLYFVPRDFQFDADSFDDRFCFVGPCLNRPPRSSWKNNSGGRPILLISESWATKESNYFKTCIDAFAESDYHVVFSVGENSPQNYVDSLPANFEINKDAYNTAILPHAALMICQAGMGTPLEALAYGVPVLAAAPRSPYHSEVAYRIAELGLGLHLPECDMTPVTLRASVDRIVGDRALLSRVKHMQERLRSAGGAKMAADRIEEHLADCINPGQRREAAVKAVV